MFRAFLYLVLLFICTSTNSKTTSTESSDQPLNSERIAARFGSYGIELILQNSHYRISNLYSEASGVRTTRTIAVADFISPVNTAISKLHKQVLSGQSFGTTFKNRGWQITKINLALEALQLEGSNRAQSLMHFSGDKELALHLYLLKLSKGGVNIDYAVLAELHHPEYLDLRALENIYGEAIPSDPVAIPTHSIKSTLIEFING